MSRDPRWAVGKVYREEVKEMATVKRKPVAKKATPKKKIAKKGK